MSSSIVVARVLLLIWMLPADIAFAQNYPTKPIRIVTGAAGGSTDFTSRLVAQGLTANLGQQVIVDNRGSGFGPAEVVMKAPPDGYSLLLDAGSFLIGPLLQGMPYDPVRDFEPITLAVSAPAIVVVSPSLPVKSVKELIALAKAKPGTLNYASGPAGGAPHLFVELFNAKAGINIVRIGYKGQGPALPDLMAGQVHVMFGTLGTVAPHIKSGKLRALAVTSAQPSMPAPELATVSASGLPGYEAISLLGMFAPARTPTPLIKRLNQEIGRVLNQADVKSRLFDAGVEVVGSTPEQLTITMKSQIASFGKLIKDAGIRAE